MKVARNKLTVTQINASTKTLLGDGDGLYLRRSKSATRSWIFVFHWQGKRREIGLGSYNSGTAPVGLVAARKRADMVRAQLADGIDPLAEKRKAAEVPTFGKAADIYIDGQRAGWTNSKHEYQWTQTLGDAYCSAIRGKPVSAIDVDDILAVLRPIWLEKVETANRLRMRLEKVLDFAKVKGWREGANPAVRKGNLDHLLPKRTTEPKHHAAIPYADVPTLMNNLLRLSGVGAEALRFTILTASRTNEVVGARWEEFDLESKIWTVPASRMKMRREHRVPLSDAAVKIVVARLSARSGDFVFPGQNLKRPMSNATMDKALSKIAPAFTVHGMRSTFRDWTGDMTTFPREVAEAALAHAVGDATEAAYRRSDALEKRRGLMMDWGAYCAA